MLISLPFALALIALPAPATGYTANATITVDGQTVGTPALTFAADEVATIETPSYRLTVKAKPAADGTTQVESGFALPSAEGWKEYARMAMPTKTGRIAYVFDNNSTKFAVTVAVTPR